jgi:hypothetical protein
MWRLSSVGGGQVLLAPLGKVPSRATIGIAFRAFLHNHHHHEDFVSAAGLPCGVAEIPHRPARCGVFGDKPGLRHQVKRCRVAW